MNFSLFFHDIYIISFFLFLLVLQYFTIINLFFFNIIRLCHYCKFSFRSYHLFGDPNSRASPRSLNEASLSTNVNVQTLTVSVTSLWQFLLKALTNTSHTNKSLSQTSFLENFSLTKLLSINSFPFSFNLHSTEKCYS